MNPTVDYGVIRPEEHAAYLEMLNWAFVRPTTTQPMPTFIDRIGPENIRILREAGRPVGGLGIIPMGQWFGGQRLAMGGIAAVAVAPDKRGRGVATQLMQAVVREMQAAGTPLSALYPATQPVYRAVGYELAGSRCLIRIPTGGIGLKQRLPELRMMTPADIPAIQALYRERARQSNGALDRFPPLWDRVFKPKGDALPGFLAERDGRLEGYCVISREPKDGFRYNLALTDMTVTTPEAGRRLLTLFADHRSLGDDVEFYGGPVEPILMLLPERGFDVHNKWYWMLRIVDVPSALSGRGYPEGVETELHLSVRDDLIPENNGPFVLEVFGGRSRVKPGGEGRLKLDVRALAALYSGFLSPAQLVGLGQLEAPEVDLKRAAVCFAGPAPAMGDMF